MFESEYKQFREEMEAKPREELLEIIKEQNPDLYKNVRRIEWVFRNKMTHLQWPDGDPIVERDLTQKELALLIDPPFKYSEELADMGFDEDEQFRLYIMRDPVLWVRHILNANPRAYQVLILRDPSDRKILRAGRRLGKSWVLSAYILWYSWTTTNGRTLVLAPFDAQVKLIYKEVLNLAENSTKVLKAIVRKPQTPHAEIDFSTGSAIRFFTTGSSSGGKSNATRGQEAQVIVLDEMDYMQQDDLVALYAMLQRTHEDDPEKVLIGASTPSGQKGAFYHWANSERFQEWWFPSYVNPMFTKDMEDEMKEHYSPNEYRREIEADWGESEEGVYAKKNLDRVFLSEAWKYTAKRTSQEAEYYIGVDWDKYGAGPNIGVVEKVPQDFDDDRVAGLLRLSHREEIPKDSEYPLITATNRIIELNSLLEPNRIVVDRGFGEDQYERMAQYGVENPQTKLRDRLLPVNFSEKIELKDPFNKKVIKKHVKPYMVEILQRLIEGEEIFFPGHDSDLYDQLAGYIVKKVNEAGRPIFEGLNGDHAHDAIALACLGYAKDHDKLHARPEIAKRAATARIGQTFSDVDDDEGSEIDNPIILPRANFSKMQRPKAKRAGGQPRRRKRF